MMLTLATRRCLATRSAPVSRQLATARHFQSSSKAAEQEDAAFSPDKTRPEEQKETAAKEANKTGNLAATTDDSPANPESSKPRDPQEGGSQGSKPEEGGGGSDRRGASGGGRPPKAGGGKSGGGPG